MTLQWKRPYRDIVVEVKLPMDPSRDEEEVDLQLLAYRKSRSDMVVQTEDGGKVAPGCVVVLDFECFQKEDRKPIPALAVKGWRLDTEDRDILPGMIENVIGMAPE